MSQTVSHMKTGPMNTIAGESIFVGKGISLEKGTGVTFGRPKLSANPIEKMKLEGPPHFNGQKPRV